MHGTLTGERQIAVVGAISTDSNQWMLQRARTGNGGWRAISFVRTSKAILRRCCRENGVPPTDIESLLVTLPDFFPGWDAEAEAFADGYSRFIAGKAPAPVWGTEVRSNQTKRKLNSAKEAGA